MQLINEMPFGRVMKLELWWKTMSLK
jgi:hypothetical protein